MSSEFDIAHRICVLGVSSAVPAGWHAAHPVNDASEFDVARRIAPWALAALPSPTTTAKAAMARAEVRFRDFNMAILLNVDVLCTIKSCAIFMAAPEACVKRDLIACDIIYPKRTFRLFRMRGSDKKG